jgi:hypothetical protein
VRTLVTSEASGTWRRDVGLLLRMVGMVIRYSTVGARLRRAYRRCEARREVYWVDEAGPTGHREEALRGR